MASGILAVLLLWGSSAPLSSCAEKLMRKEAATAVSYALSPSGATAKSPAISKTSEINKGSASLVRLEDRLSDYEGDPIVGNRDDEFDSAACQVDLLQAQTCKSDGPACSAWVDRNLREETKLAYAAAFLAAEAELAERMPLSMFGVSPGGSIGGPPVEDPFDSDAEGEQQDAGCIRDHSCLDLRVNDPAVWCCDCMIKMMEACGGVSQTCFRDHMCDHSRVSKAWKSSHECTENQIANGCDECQAELDVDNTRKKKQEHDSARLLDIRALSGGSKSEAEGNSLDETLKEKCED